MKEIKETKNIEKIFKSLGNNRRLKIISYLDAHKEASVGELAEAIKLSFKSTSKHLKILDAVDLVEKEQRGPNMFYRLSEPRHKFVSILLSL